MNIHSKSNLIAANYEYSYAFGIATDETDGTYTWNFDKLQADRKQPHYFRPGQCAACGQHNYHNGVVLIHTPTGQLVELGWKCADNLDLGLQYVSDKATTLQQLARLRRETEEVRRKAELASAAQTWLRDHAAAAEALADTGWSAFARLMADSLATWGHLTEKQEQALLSVWEQHKAEANGLLAEAPTGRVAVVGFIQRIRLDEVWICGRPRITSKVLLLVVNADGRRWRAWGTLPNAASTAQVGDQLAFSAEFKPSDKDTSFGFFKRPTKVTLTTKSAQA